MADTTRFWLDRRVDGFRVDASALLIKDDLLRDNHAMHCIEYIRGVLDEYDERLLCGEVQGKTDRIGHFYGNSKPRLHLPLNFALLDTEWNAVTLQATIDAYYNAIPDGAWPDFVIGGHDKHRVASKLGQAQSRVLAMQLMTIRGTPFLFAGDEIGSEQVKIPPERIRDPFEKLVKGFDLGRDPERAPLRWDDTERGGFTTGEPWLPLSEDRSRSIEAPARPAFAAASLTRADCLAAHGALPAARRVPAIARAQRHFLVRAPPGPNRNPGRSQPLPRAAAVGTAGQWRQVDLELSRPREGKSRGADPSAAE
jgi:alpha-glucosidase